MIVVKNLSAKNVLKMKRKENYTEFIFIIIFIYLNKTKNINTSF